MSGSLNLRKIYNDDPGAVGTVLQALDAGGEKFNAKAFGALANGLTSDVSSLQETVAALPAAGGTVKVPAGTYVLDSTTLLAAGHGKVCFEGEPGARFLVRAGSSARPFVIRDCDRVELRNIEFYLDESLRLSGLPYHGLDIQNVRFIDVIACRFFGFTNWGLSVTENSADSSGAACDFLTVERCHFEECGTFGVQHFPKEVSERCSYIDNTFVNCGRAPFGASDPVSFKAAQATRQFIARGNVVIGGRTAFGLMNWHSAEFEDNWAVNTDGYAFAVTVSVHPLYTATFEYLSIRNNTAIWTQDFVPSENYAAFALNGTNDSVGLIEIEGNTAHGYGRPYSVRLGSETPNIRFRRNKFIDCRAPAICDDSAGAHPLAPEWVQNEFINTDPTRNVDARMSGRGVRSERNLLDGYGDRPLRVSAAGGHAHIGDNDFRNPNPAGVSAARGAVFLQGAGVYHLTGNDVEDPENRVSYLIEDGGATSIYERGNTASRLIAVATPGAPIIAGSTALGWSSQHGLRDMVSNAAPVGGTFTPGDRVRNRNPYPGGPSEWVYTSAGWAPVQAGARAAINGTPAFEGQIAVVGREAYVAVGTDSSADWKPIT